MKRIDIENLLRWAYRDELPKASVERRGPGGHGKGWQQVSRFGELLANVQEADMANVYGVLPLLDGSPDDPHPDAVAVADAVLGLVDLHADMPDGWAPLSDMGDLGPEGADAVRRGLILLMTDPHGGPVRLRRPLSMLVMRQALLGCEPVWQAEAPERRPLMNLGRPRWFRQVDMTGESAFGPTTIRVEVDGFDARRRRPYPDAYRKFVLVPDPVDVVVARAEYELWVAALHHLADALRGVLSAHEVLPPARMVRPWEMLDHQPRIIPSLRGVSVADVGSSIPA